jgi:hypothetical protein
MMLTSSTRKAEKWTYLKAILLALPKALFHETFFYFIAPCGLLLCIIDTEIGD